MTTGVPTRRILVVDDESSARDSIKRMLMADGYEVELAANAEEALDLFKRAKFNLIITDYALPLKKGDQLARAIKAIDPSQPVALITAYAEAIRYARTPLETVDLVIDKPISWYQFREAVAKLLGP
jgi:ATP-dependent Lon protease